MRLRSGSHPLAAALAAWVPLLPDAAEAGRKVIIADGTADPKTQATAAAMALFPVVACWSSPSRG